MKRKIGIIACIALVVFMLIVVIVDKNSNNNVNLSEKEIIVNVFNKENVEIYNEEMNTDSNYLIEVIEEIEELNVVSEEGAYGAYITSIMGIKQGDNFYWTYYIDGGYADTGVSNCKIEDGKTYTFKIEEYNY